MPGADRVRTHSSLYDVLRRADGPDVEDVELTISVTDTAGAPVRAVPLSVTAYHDTQSVYLATGVTTDSLGIFRLTDTLARTIGGLDSIRVLVIPWGGECNAFQPQTALLQRQRRETQLSLHLEVQPTAPLATAAPGESCGLGLGIFFELHGSAFWLRLQIDSITDSIRGQWRIDFQATIASMEGIASGPVRADSLVLHLEPNSLFPPPICTPVFRLAAGLGAGQTVGLVRLIDQQGCGWSFPSSSTPFWLIPFDSFSFP